MDEKYVNALKKHYQQLVGYKITEVIVLQDDEDTDELFSDDCPRICLAMKKGKKEIYVEILSDEEGNGTGFLDIFEMNPEGEE